MSWCLEKILLANFGIHLKHHFLNVIHKRHIALNITIKRKIIWTKPSWIDNLASSSSFSGVYILYIYYMPWAFHHISHALKVTLVVVFSRLPHLVVMPPARPGSLSRRRGVASPFADQRCWPQELTIKVWFFIGIPYPETNSEFMIIGYNYYNNNWHWW